MKDQFKRILSLVRKTGDTMIVTDPDGKDAYVVMDLDQYELFLGFSGDEEDMPEEDYYEEESLEDDLLVEENLSTDEEAQPAPTEDLPDIWGVMPPAGTESETWNPDVLTENEKKDLEQQYKTFIAQNIQDAVGSSEEPAQQPQDASEQPQPEQTNGPDDEFGEEQFYLEPIE